jgi:hypothetical protein
MIDKTDWSKSSKQIIVSESAKNIVNKITGQGYEFIVNALQWVNKNIPAKRNHSDWNTIFRKRTSDQIIKDGFSTGCTDTALVFIALSRTKGIPTKYIEAINKEWLNSDMSNLSLRGHVFAEVNINNEWVIVDPESMKIHTKKNYDDYIVFKKDLDSWNMGISSYEDIKDKFLNFKKSFSKKNEK